MRAKEIDNIERFCVEISERIGKFTEEINIEASLKTLSVFSKLLKDIPDEIQDTQLFAKVQKLRKKNIKYEDAIWVVEEFGQTSVLDDWKSIPEFEEDKSELQRYIIRVILSKSINNREKLPVLLSHIEPLIYETLAISKNGEVGIKRAVCSISMENNSGMSSESIGKVFVMAIVYIIFANTDLYTDEIDKKLPFRNNILHNGLVAYKDKDIDIAYELLVNFIDILLTIRYRKRYEILNKR